MAGRARRRRRRRPEIRPPASVAAVPSRSPIAAEPRRPALEVVGPRRRLRTGPTVALGAVHRLRHRLRRGRLPGRARAGPAAPRRARRRHRRVHRPLPASCGSQVAELESPERIVDAASSLGMVPPPERHLPHPDRGDDGRRRQRGRPRRRRRQPRRVRPHAPEPRRRRLNQWAGPLRSVRPVRDVRRGGAHHPPAGAAGSCPAPVEPRRAPHRLGLGLARAARCRLPPPARRARRRPGRHDRRGNPFRRLRAVLVVFAILFLAVAGRLAQLQVVDRGSARGRAARTSAPGRSRCRPTVGRSSIATATTSRCRCRSRPCGPTLATSTTRSPPPPPSPRSSGVPAAELQDALDADGEFAYLARQVDRRRGRAGRRARRSPASTSSTSRPASTLRGDLLRSVLGQRQRRQRRVRRARAPVRRPPHRRSRRARGRARPERPHDPRAASATWSTPAVPATTSCSPSTAGMQYAAEQALAAQIERMGAHGGTVIVTDPRNGEILAMANLQVPAEGGPATADAATTWRSRRCSSRARSTRSSRSRRPSRRASCRRRRCSTVPDRLQVSDHLFTDHDPHPTAAWTPTDILATSSNIGTIMLGRQLGPERVDDVPPALRLRRTHRARLPERVQRLAARRRRVVGHVDRLDPDRPGHRGHGDADAGRVQRHRQRWCVRRAEARARVDRRRRPPPRHRRRRPANRWSRRRPPTPCAT